MPLFLIQPTLFKRKGNRDFIACVSPRYEQFACSNLNKLPVIFTLIGGCDKNLVKVSRHSIEWSSERLCVHPFTTLDTSPLLLEVINAWIFLSGFIFCLEYKWRELTSSSQIIFSILQEYTIKRITPVSQILNRFDLVSMLLQFDVTYPAEPPCKMLLFLVNGGTRFYIQRNVLRICPFLTAGMSPDLVPGNLILLRSGLSLGTRGGVYGESPLIPCSHVQV